MNVGVQQFSEIITHHGEGPVWVSNRGLHVLDMLAGDVVSLSTQGREVSRHHIDAVLAAVRPRRSGGFVAGVERGFVLLDECWQPEEFIEVWEDPSIRMNDGACDPHGNFWCGSMAYDLKPRAAALWRFDRRRHTSLGLDEVGCSNGLAWTMSGNFAYYVDSLAERIDVLRIDSESGQITDRQWFAAVPDGFPDGIAVDVEDGVWLALFGKGHLVHFDASGTRDITLQLPVSQPTACTFGGHQYQDLYVTTSRHDLHSPEPNAGAVFVHTPSVPGFAPFAFAG